MSVTTTIRNLSKQLAVNGTAYFNCPNCDRKNKLGITKYPDKILFQCFSASCNIKGQLSISPSKETISNLINKTNLEKPRETFILPDYLVEGFATTESLNLAKKYNLLEAYQLGVYKTAYDPRLNRQVFYIQDSDSKIVGAMGRALSEHTRKAYIYPNSIKYPFIIGNNDKAVLVEDIFSAINVFNIGYTGIALQGTSLQLEYLDVLKKYKEIVIALDKDASIKSIELKKLLQMFTNNVTIVLLDKDIKDMPVEKVKELLS